MKRFGRKTIVTSWVQHLINVFKKKNTCTNSARGGSEHKIQKFKKINNISLLGHTLNFVGKCDFFDETIVSAGSEKISNEVKKFNAKILDKNYIKRLYLRL